MKIDVFRAAVEDLGELVERGKASQYLVHEALYLIADKENGLSCTIVLPAQVNNLVQIYE
jgi:hypothetical protein